jgi:hypothetical protein
MILFIGVEKKKIVSPVVSPGQVKMGRLLITREEHESIQHLFNTAICARLMT